MAARRVVVIVNSRAREGNAEMARARALIDGCGIDVAEWHALPDPRQVAPAVRAAVQAGHRYVVIGGGDGTISAAVDALAGKETVLGILPMGTANDFARTLGIPATLAEACTVIAGGEVAAVDVGHVGGRGYVNVASMGLAVEVTQALSPGLKRGAGPLAYPLAALWAFLRHRPFSARLEFPEGDHPPDTCDRLLQVAVGNGRFYGGGMVVAPRASIDDGTLDVYAITLGRRRDWLGILRYFKSGDFISSKSVRYYRTRAVHVETQPRRPINVDGEIVGLTPQTFTLAPRALRVLVPPQSPVADGGRRDGAV